MAQDKQVPPGGDRPDDDYFCIDEPLEPNPSLPLIGPDDPNLRLQPVTDTSKPLIDWPVPAVLDIGWADD